MRVMLAMLSFGLTATAQGDSSITTTRTITPAAEGVYMIRHADAPDGYPQGNTIVVIGQRAVLVVDSAYLPSAAREDIAQIRRWTSLPVRYLLNTHWHPDHVRGNAVYVEAFPQVEIIAHANTLRLMNTYEPGNRERYPQRVAALEESLAAGRDVSGEAVSGAKLDELRRQLVGRKQVLAEMQSARLQPPTVTFDRELHLDLGGRVAQIRHSGAGDTQGDAWVWLPRERLLVAGDLLAAPVPYFFAGYPAGVAHSLQEMINLDPLVVAPGHGELMRDQRYLRDVHRLVEHVVQTVNASIGRRGSLGAKLEDVSKDVDVSEYRRRFAGDDSGSQEYFDESIAALIRNAFHQAPK